MTNATIELLDRLVAFDTISSKSNLPLLDYVRDYLERFGVTCQYVYNEEGSKANLYCTIGPHSVGGILLSGHTDVVPVEQQTWDTEPFRLVRKGDRLYGRGTADMKGFIAAILARIPQMVEAPLATPIHLSLSHDEEVGCVGVRSLVRILAKSEQRPRFCIVGEPTEMQVVIAHKGKQYLRAHVRGREGHASLSPYAVNAIEYAANLIVYLYELGERKRQQGPFDEDFDVSYTTVMTGIVHGGTNLNIVPNHCWFDFEVRELPGDDPFVIIDELKLYAHQVLEPRMQEIDPSTGIEFEEVSLRPSLNTRPDEEIVTLAKRWANCNAYGKVAFGTEAALFQHQASIPSVVCGPGSIKQAHKPNEYIEIVQLERFGEFLNGLITWAMQPDSDPT